ncbi:thiamine pyrophosphate-binding protein [Streptosporangium sp. NPDC051022]|uniref:thiamine pyrophosphate-binding protein n=1 Tax=Streptosporangium sp. NPDC051022 TaxID=3155752 RepID=UPI00343C8523
MTPKTDIDPSDAERTSPTGADALVEALVAVGIEHIFGVPGDTGVGFYDALARNTGRIRHVLARDERHAAFMADAYARSTNRLGVVEVSSGGGTTFVVGGMGESFASGVPVLLITSDIHTSSHGTGALTEIDQVKLFSAVTKHIHVVQPQDDIAEVIREAATVAVSGRPAPVAVIFPEDVFDRGETVVPRSPGSAPVSRTRTLRAPAESVARAASLLATARRPAVYAGSGVHSSEAWEELAALATRAALPVATSIHGKGSVTDDFPLSLGVSGNNGGRDYALEYLSGADVVLFVGTRANATDTNAWTAPDRGSVRAIQIDVEAARAGRNFPGAISLPGDARTVLAALHEAVPAADETVARNRVEWIAKARAAWAANFAKYAPEPGPGRLAPAEVVTTINRLAGDDVIAVGDPGTPTPYLASFWHLRRTGRNVIIPRGHGPMGYAIPAAVGVAVGNPGTPVVSFTADGSFAMSCGELETVVRLGLPIAYVQFTNFSLGWIKMLQHLYYGETYFGVDPGPTDAPAVARASGLEAARVTTPEELETAVAGFLADPRPLYLDVTVPHMIESPPPVSSWWESMEQGAGRPVY